MTTGSTHSPGALRGRAADSLGRRLDRARAEAWWELMLVPAALIVLGIVLTATSPYFLTGLNLTNVLLQGAALAAMSFGVTFVMLAGDLDLSVGSGSALCSVVGAFVMRDTGSVLVGALAGIGVGLLIGLVNGLVITILQTPSFIATLGMLVIAQGVALALTNGGVVTGLPASSGDLASNTFLGVPWIVWVVFVILFAVLYFIQSQTAFGLRVFAVGGNREAARLSAIPVSRIRVLCFMISGITMGIAGFVFTTRVQSGQPSAGASLELYTVAAIVLGGTSLYGGKGSLLRTMWGVLFIVTLQNGLDLAAVSDTTQQVVIGIVLIVAASTDFMRAQLRRRKIRAVALDVDVDSHPETKRSAPERAPAGDLGGMP